MNSKKYETLYVRHNKDRYIGVKYVKGIRYIKVKRLTRQWMDNVFRSIDERYTKEVLKWDQ